ncbi:MAG TPA: DNA-binding response regulator [Clostridiales bacterium]|jgi:DNA-binding response OmpR family regulator|nr:DNA-binding response regulator [Clostridiales bacterium]
MNILIAEDERELRDLLTLNLEKENYEVICAKNGKDALDLFNSKQVDLGIFDVMMPELDGFNLLRKIREKSDVPIIMLTARDTDMDKLLGFGLGADDYLVKPFSMVELIARVGVRLNRRHPNLGKSASKLLTIGELTLDIDACSAYKNDVTIDLNAKEFLLLKHFMENPERVFTKKQLYSAVWNEDYYYDDNTIMVHISHIRKKIEANSKQPFYLKTIKGIGYKFSKGATK